MTLPLGVSRVGDGSDGADDGWLGAAVLAAPVAFALFDSDLRFRYANEAYARLNERPVADHIGRKPHEVLSRRSGEALEQVVRKVFDEGEPLVQDDFIPFRRHGGERFRATWYPVRDGDGYINGVAVSIEDVTLHWRTERARRRQEERTAALQAATTRLARTMTVNEVAHVMAEVVSNALCADYAGVVLPYGDVLRVPQPLGWQDPGWYETPLTRNTLVTWTFKQQIPYYFASPEEFFQRIPYPNVADFLRATEERAWAAIPLLTTGKPLGLLRVAFRSPRTFDHDERAFLEALAAQCALAVERAQLFAHERQRGHTIQASLLPASLPRVPGLSIAQQYRAFAGDEETGGDWYDAFVLPDGRVGFSLGDVMGKGLPAAAGMGRIRSAVRAVAYADPSPAAVLSVLDRLYACTERDEYLTTVVYGVIDPQTGDVQVGDAGHLPLLILGVDGNVRAVDAGPQATPLGVADERTEMDIRLETGETLFAYSDGLVEQKGRSYDEGQERLLEVVRSVPIAPLSTFCKQVVDLMVAGISPSDDVTLLAIRRG
jgi:PAS domain S-box-containing protein